MSKETLARLCTFRQHNREYPTGDQVEGAGFLLSRPHNLTSKKGQRGQPRGVTHPTDGIREGRVGFDAPGGLTDYHVAVLKQRMSARGRPGKETPQEGGCTRNRQIGPLPLGLLFREGHVLPQRSLHVARAAHTSERSAGRIAGGLWLSARQVRSQPCRSRTNS